MFGSVSIFCCFVVFVKEINTQQGHIKLIESENKTLTLLQKKKKSFKRNSSFELYIHQS